MNDYEKWLEDDVKCKKYIEMDFGDDPKYIYKCGIIDGLHSKSVEALQKYRSFTCKMEPSHGFFICSSCKHKHGGDAHSFGYCPNCGRKVE